MFNTEEDYENAIKDAQLHQREIKVSSKKLLGFNLFFMLVLSYGSFIYLKNRNNTFSLPISKQAVLGVSETIDDAQIENEKLMDILNKTEVDTLENSIKISAKKSSIQSQSFYTEAISRELDEKRSGFRGKIAVANQKEYSLGE